MDQETGVALGRGVYIIPVNVGINPYGFIGRYQAVAGVGKEASPLADEIFDLLLRDPRSAGQMVEALVSHFERTSSWTEAHFNWDRLERSAAFTRDQVERIALAYETNSQLRGAFYVQNRIHDFLKRHWATHGVAYVREEELDDENEGAWPDEDEDVEDYP